MRAMRAMRLPAIGALLVAGACSAELPIEGEWSGRDVDGSYVGYTFDADSTAMEVRGDSVRECRYRLDSAYDPPRLELTSAGPARPGVVLTRREMR